MEIDYSEISYLKDPHLHDLHADNIQFLLSTTGPTVIDITGKDTSKCRVINSLLQGDEPSGLIAMHRWLTTRDRSKLPETNLRFILCSVEAASKRPFFTHRFIDGSKDINRCFGSIGKAATDQENQQGCYQRAKIIEQAIRDVNPEIIIDLHNASSSSPAFAVTTLITTETLAVASFFSQTLVLSDLQLGSLMGQNFSCPFISIECGGSLDEQSHEVAYAGIKHIAQCEQINYIHQDKKVEVIYQPLRLQIKEDVDLSYAKQDEGDSGVTLKNNLEYFNFGGANQDEMIGWIDGNGIDNLALLDKQGKNVIADYFYTRENQLVCKHNLRVFKATTNKQAALNDCLLYVVKNHKGDS